MELIAIMFGGKKVFLLIPFGEKKQRNLMQVESNTRPFEIQEETLQEWTRRPHQHNFFELVYIKAGEGSQCINDNILPYGKDSIFLLPPYDCHSFKIQSPTTFVFIRFNALFFQEDKQQLMNYSSWFNNLHYILSSYNRMPGDVIQSATDKAVIISLIGSMLEEIKQPEHSESILRTNMVAMLNLVLRNFENTFRQSHSSLDAQAKDLLQYIQYNLFDNDKLKAESIAEQFNIAPTYVGEYFKKKIGENLKEYVLRSRVNVAQSRMQYSGKSVKEIAYDLGFTDSSHLLKSIKKYYDTRGQVCSSLTNIAQA